jgi:diadenylate cyclase
VKVSDRLRIVRGGSKIEVFFVYSLIRWQDVVDIIIMSVLVYQLYGWFKHTKALQVVVGLGSLGVVYLATRSLGFYMTSWILQELGTVLFVLIIVIFQAEIRQALYRISPLRRLFGRQEGAPLFDLQDFAEAIFSLATSRTGAIIVFQRSEPIDEYISNGIAIDSCINGQLISSIFNVGSPLHDGALIIRNGRISRASAHLPLSTSNEIPHYFGTRHRAGIGLAERSDAAVVIVSEERGEVSLALSRELSKVASSEHLALHLGQLLAYTEREEVRLTVMRRLFRNFWAKLITVLLVSLCWLLITAKQGEIVTILAPVQFRNLSESLLLRKSDPEQVELQLKSVSSLIPIPKEGDVVAVVDLAKVQSGTNQVLIRKENISLPSGVVVTQVKPVSLRVTIERKVRKDLRVTATLRGTPKGKLQLRRVTVVPPMVTVEGPESVLSRMETIRTEVIRLSDVEKSTTVEKRLELPAHLRLPNEEKIQVRIILGK